jgi:hypothetical protein
MLQLQCNILRPLPAIAPDHHIAEADGDELPSEIGVFVILPASNIPYLAAQSALLSPGSDALLCCSVDAHWCRVRYSAALLAAGLFQQAGPGLCVSHLNFCEKPRSDAVAAHHRCI